MFYKILLPMCILSSSITCENSSQSEKNQSSDSDNQADAEHLDPEGFVFDVNLIREIMQSHSGDSWIFLA